MFLVCPGHPSLMKTKCSIVISCSGFSSKNWPCAQRTGHIVLCSWPHYNLPIFCSKPCGLHTGHAVHFASRPSGPLRSNKFTYFIVFGLQDKEYYMCHYSKKFCFCAYELTISTIRFMISLSTNNLKTSNSVLRIFGILHRKHVTIFYKSAVVYIIIILSNRIRMEIIDVVIVQVHLFFWEPWCYLFTRASQNAVVPVTTLQMRAAR